MAEFETELCTYIIGWPNHDPGNIERCGRFARYMIVHDDQFGDPPIGYSCMGHIDAVRWDETYFDMYGEVATV